MILSTTQLAIATVLFAMLPVFWRLVEPVER